MAQRPAFQERVDAVFARFDRAATPGCAMGVFRPGEPAVTGGYGMANLEHAVPITTASVFRIGSAAKQFTAAAIVLLERQGALSLDDDIRGYLPEVPDYGTPITIRHLLHHTSGIRDYLTLMFLAGKRSADYYTPGEVLEMIARQRDLNFRPGTRYLYSNSGYFLLSEIVTRVTGLSLREYAAREIFEPLGMASTHFHDDHTEIVPRRASGYAPNRAGAYRVSMTDLEMVGDGGLFTTVEDLQRWEANMYPPHVVGGEGFLDAMERRGVLSGGDTLTYALGLTHGRYRGVRTVGHGGAFVGFRSHFLRFPSERVAIVVLCNVSDADPEQLARRVADIVLDDALQPVAEPDGDFDDAPVEQRGSERGYALPAEALSEFAGTFYSAELDVVYRIELRGGRLYLQMGQAFEGPLETVQPNVFHAVGAPLTLRFYRTNDEAVSTFLLDAGRARDLRFVRR